MNLDDLVEEVLKRLQTYGPRTLLIGDTPEDIRIFDVKEPPYEQVVIGHITPSELLQMPSEPVCKALLEGIPVWLYPQPYRYGSNGLLLRRALMEAEQRLIQFGARPVFKEGCSSDCRYRHRKSLGNQEVRDPARADFFGSGM